MSELGTLVQLSSARYSEATPEAGPWEVACASQGLDGVTDVTGVSHQQADSRVAQELDLNEGDPVVLRTNRMRAGDQVIQLQETWLPDWVAGGTPLALPGKVVGGIYGGLAAVGHSPANAVEMVTGRMPTPAEAEALGLRSGSSVLDARRTTRDRDGRALVHTHVVLAADHACLVYPQAL
jgi:GntR family transcriptional regulator